MPYQCHVPGCSVVCANAGARSNHYVKAMHPPKPQAGRKRFSDFVGKAKKEIKCRYNREMLGSITEDATRRDRHNPSRSHSFRSVHPCTARQQCQGHHLTTGLSFSACPCSCKFCEICYKTARSRSRPSPPPLDLSPASLAPLIIYLHLTRASQASP